MRAVNLIPADQRGGTLGAGRSGGMVYGVLAALVAVLLGVSIYALAGRDVKNAEQEVATIEVAAQQYQAAAQQYASYESAAAEATARIAAVKGLSEARFDWAGSMRDLSRIVPSTTQVYELSANVRPAVGSPKTTSSLRDALPVPAITIRGCSRTQETVADLMTRLQAMRRVTQVTLENSERSADAEPSAADPSGQNASAVDSSGCSLTSKSHYTFTLVVFFAPGASQPGADAAPGSTPGALPGAVPAPTPASSTTGTDG